MDTNKTTIPSTEPPVPSGNQQQAQRNGQTMPPPPPTGYAGVPRQGAPGYYPAGPQPFPRQAWQAPPFPAQQKKRESFELKKRDLVFSALFFLLTFLGVSGAISDRFNAGFSVFLLAGFFLLTAYLFKREARPGILPVSCGVLSLLSASVFFLSENELVRFLTLLLFPALNAVYLAGLSGYSLPKGDMAVPSHIARVLSPAFSAAPKSIRSLFQSKNPHVKTASRVLLGLGLSLPVLLAVVPLLANSDAAFSNLLGKLFANTGIRFLELLLSLLILPLVLGFVFSLRKTKQTPQKPSTFRGMDTVILTSMLCVLSLCYLVYLFSQLAYFFSGFLGILPEGYGFSHAEYARRGFFELCAIAGINLAVLLAVLLLARKKEGKLPVALRIPSVFICAFNLLLIGTALSKLSLYISVYGMTVLRIGTSAFAVFTAVVFICLALRCFTPKINVLGCTLLSAACVLLILGTGNVNRFVAKYNYTLYETGKTASVDVDYLESLGADGIPYLLKLTEANNSDVAAEAKLAVYREVRSLYNIDKKGPGAYQDLWKPGHKRNQLSQYTLPTAQAYDLLDSYLQANPDFMFEQEKEAYRRDMEEYFSDSFD